MVSVTITVTLPKTKFASKKWKEQIASAQRRIAIPKLRALFNKTVFGWSKKPSFGWVQIKTNDTIGIEMYPQGEGADVWLMLNEGVRAHEILPKKPGGLLWFRPGYRASTTVGVLQSRRNYRSGKIGPARRIPLHPGVEARKFTDLIAETFADDFGVEMQKAITKAARQK